MAEAYKGLTIRIGADTTDFARKLKSLGSAISATQAGLKQMTRALQENPQNIDAMNQKFALLGNQATNLNAKLHLVKTELQQMNERGIGALAEQTENSALAVVQLKDRLNQVNKLLEEQHDKLKTFPEINGKAYDPEHPRAYATAVRKAAEAGDEVAKSIQEEVQNSVTAVEKLKRESVELNQKLETMKDIDAYKSLQTDAIALESEIKKVYADMLEMRYAMPSEAEAQKVNLLETEFKELSDDLRMTEEQSRALKSSLYLDPKNPEKFDAAVKSVAHQMELAAKMSDNLKNRIKAISEANNLGKVEGSLSELEAAARKSGDEFDQLKEALAETKARISSVEAEQKSYANTARTTDAQNKANKKSAKALGEELATLKNREKAFEEAAREAGEQARMDKAKVEVKKLEAQLVETTSKMERLANAGKQARTSMLNGFRDMATALGATVVPAIATVSTKVISAADTVDSAFRNMRKTVNGTEEQFQHLKDAAIEFSRTHPVSADTILEIEAVGGQLGIVVEELEDFAHVVSNLDIATNMDAENIALDLGKLRNIFSELGWETEAFGDSLVRLGNNTPALESDIMNITTRFAGMSAIVGVLPDEVLAIATASTATGQKADAAGGSLQRTFGRIEGAVAGVSDAMRNLEDLTEEEIEDFEKAKDKLKDYADIAGMSAEEFAQLWTTHDLVDKSITGLSTDVTGTTAAFVKFVNGLKGIKDAGGSVDATLQKLGITGVRDRQLLEGLTNTTNVLSDSLLMSKNAWNGVADQWGAAGDAAREAEKKAEGFSGRLAVLKNIVQTMGSTFGDKLVPMLNLAIDALTAATKVVDNMPAPIVNLIAVLAALTMAFPPILRNYAQFQLTMEAFTTAQAKARLSAEASELAMVKSLVTQKGAIKSFGDLKAAVSLFGEALKKNEKLVAAAKIGLKGLAVAGVAVLAVGIATLIKRQTEYIRATKSLSDVMFAAGDSARNYSNALNRTEVYYGVNNAVNELISNVSKLRGTLQDIRKGADESVVSLRLWGKQLESNLNVSADDAEAVSKQRLAVEKLNDEYGAGLSIIEENGRMRVKGANDAWLEADALNDLIEAKRRDIEMSMYAAMMEETAKARAEAEKAYADAVIEHSKAQAAFDEAVRQGKANLDEETAALMEAETNMRKAKEVRDNLTDAYDDAADAYGRATRVANGTATQIDILREKNQTLAYAMDSIADGEFEKFSQALEQEGIDTSRLADLTGVEVSRITNSWRNGTDDWKSIVRGAAADVKKEVSSAASEASVAGDNFGRGFYNAIRNWQGRIGSAAYSIGLEAVRSLNSGIDAASPSKATAKSGKWFAQGFELGMESEQSAVERQAGILGSLATGALAAASAPSIGYLSGRAAGFGSTTTNNTTHDTQYILSGDIIIQSPSGNPQEIVDEIVRVFSNAQRAYGRA